MSKHVHVKKSTGVIEPFSEAKLSRSLRNSSASEDIIDLILPKIHSTLYEGISTKEIYRKAFMLLHRQLHALAARYSLKKAIMELGPTGYPFEKYIGELMRYYGFRVEVGRILSGRCVSHEVDVIAWNDRNKYMIECKYHNTAGKVSNVQTPLYIQSRFLDVKSVWETQEENQGKKFQGWVVTNTRFSEDAKTYGKCVGLHLVDWDYPLVGSLKELVENAGLFPVTAITNLTKKQKHELIEKGAVLCADLNENPELLDTIQISPQTKEKIIKEVENLCHQVDHV